MSASVSLVATMRRAGFVFDLAIPLVTLLGVVGNRTGCQIVEWQAERPPYT